MPGKILNFSKNRTFSTHIVFLGLLLFSLLRPDTTYCLETLNSSSLTIFLPSESKIILPFGPRIDGERKFHYGIDIKLDVDEKFYSPVAGLVVFSGFTPAGSGTVSIKTDNGYIVTILQLKNIRVKSGDAVLPGFLLGEVDLNGDSSTDAPHIHLSVRDKTGHYLNPYTFIVFLNMETNDNHRREEFLVEKTVLNLENFPAHLNRDKEGLIADAEIRLEEDKKAHQTNFKIPEYQFSQLGSLEISKTNRIFISANKQMTFLNEQSGELPGGKPIKTKDYSLKEKENLTGPIPNSNDTFRIRVSSNKENSLKYLNTYESRLFSTPSLSNGKESSEITENGNDVLLIVIFKRLRPQIKSDFLMSLKVLLLLILISIDIIKRQSLLLAQGGRPIKTVGR